MLIRIIAIRKDNGNHYNPHESITAFKWVEYTNNQIGILSLSMMIEFLENGNKAYVSQNAKIVYCYVRNNGYGKFIQTASDGYFNNNLLSLPEF